MSISEYSPTGHSLFLGDHALSFIERSDIGRLSQYASTVQMLRHCLPQIPHVWTARLVEKTATQIMTKKESRVFFNVRGLDLSEKTGSMKHEAPCCDERVQ